jgi:putative transposase
MTKFDLDRQHRHSIRLKNYDYFSNGAYFITLCTYQSKCTLGYIKNGEIVLNNFGEIVKDEWFRSSELRKELILDEFVVMPNHVHAIIIIQNPLEQLVGASGTRPRQSCGLPKFPLKKGNLKVHQ